MIFPGAPRTRKPFVFVEVPLLFMVMHGSVEDKLGHAKLLATCSEDTLADPRLLAILEATVDEYGAAAAAENVASCGAVLKPNTPPAFHAACRCQRFVVGSAPLWQAEAEPPADE